MSLVSQRDLYSSTPRGTPCETNLGVDPAYADDVAVVNGLQDQLSID